MSVADGSHLAQSIRESKCVSSKNQTKLPTSHDTAERTSPSHAILKSRRPENSGERGGTKSHTARIPSPDILMMFFLFSTWSFLWEVDNMIDVFGDEKRSDRKHDRH